MIPALTDQVVDRRALLGIATTVAATVGVSADATETETQDVERTAANAANVPTVAMLIYPGMVALDLIGPMTVLTMLGCKVDLVWKDRAPVATDIGIRFAATRTFAEAPRDLDVLFVPGGILGTIACMDDAEVCGFLADRGARAKWVTAVCTGSLALAAAGLLKGYDATSHWLVADMLPLMGARHVEGRVVRDRNRMTGGGVTAGIDFGLTLAAELKGEEAARRIQLMIEYSPEAPFPNGTPAQAGPARTAVVRRERTETDAKARRAAQAAGRRLLLA